MSENSNLIKLGFYRVYLATASNLNTCALLCITTHFSLFGGYLLPTLVFENKFYYHKKLHREMSRSLHLADIYLPGFL